jgi:hypothetical protein
MYAKCIEYRENIHDADRPRVCRAFVRLVAPAMAASINEY